MARITSIKINLLPVDQEGKIQRQMLGGAMLILLLFSAGLGYHYQSYRSQVVKLEAEQHHLTEQFEPYRVVPQDIIIGARLKQQLETLRQQVEQVQRSKKQVSPILDELEKSTPIEVTLASVQIEGEKITIDGTANKHYSVAEYLAGLATNSHFKHVIMFNSTVADSGQIDFSIQCDWGGTKP